MFVPINKWTLTLKNNGNGSFSYETEALMSFILMGEWVYGAQSWKDRRLLCEYMFVPIDKWTLTLKNDGNGSFSYETEASMSFIPMGRMSLWCPILKRKEINVWIRVCPNWQTNFNSKKWWKEMPFLGSKSINVIHSN